LGIWRRCSKRPVQKAWRYLFLKIKCFYENLFVDSFISAGKKYNIQSTEKNAGNNTGTEQENWEYGAVVQKGLRPYYCPPRSPHT